ncbi:RHS repeat-associated core domain-containing protein [bacterium]|nr:RHS repeat-associated core domain-containing protein [bacterium]
MVFDLDRGGTVATRYVLAAGTLLAQVQGGTPYYLLGDAQGSTRLLVTSSGTVDESSTYDAFGVLQHSAAAPGTTYRYTGQQYDAATGLYSLRARYYQPADGRFLTRDTYPIDFQNPVELNRYGYTANNPVNGTDPSGYVNTLTYSRTTEDTTRGLRQLKYHQSTVRRRVAVESIADGLDLAMDALEIYQNVVDMLDLTQSGKSRSFTIATAEIDGVRYYTVNGGADKRVKDYLLERFGDAKITHGRYNDDNY